MIHAIAHALLIYAAAIFLHELGHASAALVFGVKVHRLGFKWYGAYVEMDMPENRFVFGFVSLAGCLTNFAFMLMGCCEGWYTFALANACLLINLFPIPHWDGWNLFQALGLVGGFRIRARLAEYGR